jgi:hypothetical protein
MSLVLKSSGLLTMSKTSPLEIAAALSPISIARIVTHVDLGKQIVVSIIKRLAYTAMEGFGLNSSCLQENSTHLQISLLSKMHL